jgi:hypothetical protein
MLTAFSPFQGKQGCLGISARPGQQGLWEDVWCTREYAFFCQRRPVAEPERVTGPQSDEMLTTATPTVEVITPEAPVLHPTP